MSLASYLCYHPAIFVIKVGFEPTGIYEIDAYEIKALLRLSLLLVEPLNNH
jgi:hypothetical protein